MAILTVENWRDPMKEPSEPDLWIEPCGQGGHVASVCEQVRLVLPSGKLT